MTTNILNSVQSILPVARFAPVKIILSVLLLSYGAFNFSVHHWVLLGLIVVAILAVSDRITRINATYKTNTSNTQQTLSRDGGLFRAVEQSRRARSRHSIVQDGGS